MAQMFVHKIWYRFACGHGDLELWLDRQYSDEEIASGAPERIRQHLYNQRGVDVGIVTIIQSRFLRIQDA